MSDQPPTPSARLILVASTHLLIHTDANQEVSVDLSPKMFAALVEQVGKAMRQAAQSQS